MGQEIVRSQFSERDFAAFRARLREETSVLAQWFHEERFCAEQAVGGFEIEAWLVNGACRPAPINQQFLGALRDPLVMAELARFNVELNSTPRPVRGASLRAMQSELEATLDACNRVAETLGVRLALIGILPTVAESDLTLANISPLQRYRALNQQILKLRGGRPLTLDIRGNQQLRSVHEDVMFESATTSMQLHWQVNQASAARVYNASQILAAPMVAACANSPYLCGRDLWDETRIPLFEQSVAVDSGENGPGKAVNRVYFGSGYLAESLIECFVENQDKFAVLLPADMSDSAAELGHLRLHNGTVWRWNRPLIGFEGDGRPHLRLEHRVLPAGPSVVDCIANAALFFGLVQSLSTLPTAPESLLPFERTRENFYRSAKDGLRATVYWLDNRQHPMVRLLLDELVPLARQGLATLKVDERDIDRYLGIIDARIRSRRTGAWWQRTFVARHGDDMAAMVQAYVEAQGSGAPVHEWEV